MASPKLDVKMLALPMMFFFNKYIDFKNPDTIKLAQAGFVSVCVVMLGLHFLVFTMISKKNTKKIWVPPKPKPALPFGLGPPPEPIKVAQLVYLEVFVYQ
jgi:hypothetical protein